MKWLSVRGVSRIRCSLHQRGLISQPPLPLITFRPTGTAQSEKSAGEVKARRCSSGGRSVRVVCTETPPRTDSRSLLRGVGLRLLTTAPTRFGRPRQPLYNPTRIGHRVIATERLHTV